jgi:hypothetical protein
MSRTLRTALVAFAVVIGILVLLHVVAPSWMSALAHHIHSR